MASGFSIALTAQAEDDLLDGYWFYEAQQADLGNYFLDSLYGDIHSLTVFAGIHAKAYPSIYRTLSARFPFAIYYVVNSNTATVLAVLDTRQNPKTIQNRLTG